MADGEDEGAKDGEHGHIHPVATELWGDMTKFNEVTVKRPPPSNQYDKDAEQSHRGIHSIVTRELDQHV